MPPAKEDIYTTSTCRPLTSNSYLSRVPDIRRWYEASTHRCMNVRPGVFASTRMSISGVSNRIRGYACHRVDMVYQQGDHFCTPYSTRQEHMSAAVG